MSYTPAVLSPTPPAKSWPSRIVRSPLLWVPVSVGLLGATLVQSGLLERPERLTAVNPWLMALATFLNLGIVLLWSVRSTAVLRSMGEPVSAFRQVPMVLMAFVLNNVTPASSGEVLRIYLLRRRLGVRYLTALASVLVERGVSLVYLVVSAVLAWLVITAVLPWSVAVVAFVVVTALPSLVVWQVARPAGLLVRLPGARLLVGDRWTTWRDGAHLVDTSVRNALLRPLPASTLAVSTYLVFACFAAQLSLVALAVGIDLPLVAAWGAIGLSFVAGIVSLLPFGLGTTDVALLGLLTLFGVPATQAATMTVGFRLVSTIPLALGGAACYAYLSATQPSTSSPEARGRD